jgi:hypothetical protein
VAAMSRLFPNHSYGQLVLKHKKLPLFMTQEFNFFRCIRFEDSFYGKTVSELHQGNLRIKHSDNRHSALFPGEKVSYWADKIDTSRAEVKKHKSGNNLLTFWAYDDAVSTFPTMSNKEPVIIIDGRDLRFADILSKNENNEPLSNNDNDIIDAIMLENPDCLAYNSHVKDGAVNFLFFEKGFRKLAMREVSLRLGDYLGKNANRIVCADTSDYIPYVDMYGQFFERIARVSSNSEYFKTEEYNSRKAEYEKGLHEISEFHRRLNND